MNVKVLCRFIVGGRVYKMTVITYERTDEVIYRIYDNRRKAAKSADYADIVDAYNAFREFCDKRFIENTKGGTL